MSQDTFSVTVNVKSLPFRDDPANADALYAAIGRALVLWGKLEFHFYSLICILWNLPGAERAQAVCKAEMPVSMKKRAKFCKVAFKTMTVLERDKAQFLSILPRIMDAAMDRATLLHSVCNGFVSDNPPTIQLIHHKRKGATLYRPATQVCRHVRYVEPGTDRYDLERRLSARSKSSRCNRFKSLMPLGSFHNGPDTSPSSADQ